MSSGKLKLSGLSSLEPDEREQVLTIATRSKEQLLTILQWGEHAHLVEWFLSVKDTLPRERFTYDQGEGWQVIWMTPAASYQNLAAEIEKGPGGQWDAEVRSILEQLHNLFGNINHAQSE
ncbi:MAG: hypothetical protein KBI48_04495 [Deltaproteobacteria bacterium]|nr:hypothetical protein [Deltaproteobacteria bacterium]